MNAPPPVASPRPATYQGVLDAPENRIAQIVDGVLHLHPVWETGPSLAIQNLLLTLMGPFDRDLRGAGGWWLLRRIEVHLGGDVLVPDLAAWRRERLPRLAEGEDLPWIKVAPDWACEVVSPTTRKLGVTGKRDAYAREGVPHLWLVDPEVRILEAFELRDKAWTLLAVLKDDDPVRLPPFDAVEWPLAELWED